MLHLGEQQRTVDSQKLGMFKDMYSQHGTQEVPGILRVCELLTPGEKVVYVNEGELVFAGLIYARGHDYLPVSINLERRQPSGPETATVSIPLSRHVTHGDRWGVVLMGGGMNRHWKDICRLVLKPNSVDESDLAGKSLSVGAASIEKRLAMTTDPLTKRAMELVLDA